MYTIEVNNVNHALPRAVSLLHKEGRHIAPRGLETLELEGPVATTYANPAEMCLFDSPANRTIPMLISSSMWGEVASPVRDANPFFHFFEALWILAGRDDVRFLAYFLPRMKDFSDNGIVFHAPYGYRMRTQFGFDQIEAVIAKLKEDPDTRQAVISIWDPQVDWTKSKDIPCNDLVMFKIRGGRLRMTVCNRSNDIILGAYGANVVQFSTLLKYVAGRVGIDIGTYTQVSDSFHLYTDNPYYRAWVACGHNPSPCDRYLNISINRSTHGWDDGVTRGECAYMAPSELASGAFDADLKLFFSEWSSVVNEGVEVAAQHAAFRSQYQTKSFQHTVVPMLETLMNWRAGEKDLALKLASDIAALDWRVAVEDWMNRRLHKQNEQLELVEQGAQIA